MIAVILSLILAANASLVIRYRRGDITYFTDLLSRMAGASFFILYIWYQYTRRLALNFGFDSPVLILSWVNWVLIMGIFVFFVVIYLIRANPVVRAQGLRETLLPLCCSVIPVVILESPRWVPIIANTLPWKLAAFSFLVVGHAITLIGFLYLGKAFSIMVQARHVVQHGPYRYIRHPIYVGEGIAMIGILLDVPSVFNLVCVIVWIAAQCVRARLEEKKLETAFGTYADYKRTTAL